MLKYIAPLFSLLALSACASNPKAWRTLDGRNLKPAVIDATTERLIAANDVKGLAVALIAGGRVSYLNAYGYRDFGKALPLETNTVMYGASLTKATFAYFVMQLVDEGVVDLDRSIGDYLPKPLPEYEKYMDLAGDERWRKLTFRILLSHMTGFSNFRFFDRNGDYDPDGKLAFYFEPGARYAYSGEGLNLAQFVLEKGLELDVGAEMQKRIFDRFAMNNTSLVWREDFRNNLAHNYDTEGKDLRHNMRSKVRAAGSMDTTLADWSNFLAAAVRGDGLSKNSKAEMIRQQIRIHSAQQFPTLWEQTTDANDDIDLGYGLGWGEFESPFGHAFFKEGHDDGTANYALCIDPKKTCILLLSNSVRAEGVFKELVETFLGDVKLPWKWENYIPYDLDDDAR
ncbi:MAG: serine hydrolase domain-containing protein [Parvularculaceae bacterium]